MKKQPQRIETQEQLDKLLGKRSMEHPLECFIQLNFGIRSSKEISMTKEGDYWILNEIDGSEEIVAHDKFMESFFGEAMSKGALYKY